MTCSLISHPDTGISLSIRFREYNKGERRTRMNLEKEKYEKPEMEVIEFECEDVISNSKNPAGDVNIDDGMDDL